MVEPLKSRTMTLDELQRETLKVLRKVRRQLNRSPYQSGMSDLEFMEEVLDPLQMRILADRDVLRQMGEISGGEI